MVSLTFLQHKWSTTFMKLKLKKKLKKPSLKAKSLDHLSDTSTKVISHSTSITSPPPFYTKRPNKLQIPKFNLFQKRHHFFIRKLPFNHLRIFFLNNILHFLIIPLQTHIRMTI